MTKKIIACDMDDVLNSLVPYWIEHYNKDYNDTLKETDITGWIISDFVKPECGEKIYEYLSRPSFFANMNPKSSSQEVTKWLSQYYDIYIVTNTSSVTYIEKLNWVDKHYPHLNIKKDSRFIALKDKHLFRADYLIDDATHNCTNFPQTTLIFDCPHNQDFINNNPNKKVYRVKDWNEIAIFFSKELIKDKENIKC